MFRFTSLFQPPRPKRKNIIRKLRRLVHQRNYWRNKSIGRRPRRRR